MLCSNCKVLLLGGQGDETLEDKNDQTLEVCCLFLNDLNTIVFFFSAKRLTGTVASVCDLAKTSCHACGTTAATGAGQWADVTCAALF